MIELLDYILDEDDNFWIINNLTDVPKGFMIYKVNDEGLRYNRITNKKYTKESEKGLLPIPQKYKMLFKPREFYKENKSNLFGIWKEYVEVLNSIGISDDNIGIFGSYLIGFAVERDIDFVIYGIDNLELYYKNNELIKERLNATKITDSYIEYQYKKFKDRYPVECDLKEIIKRNWSGIQFNEILSTPRFIDTNNTLIPKKEGIDKIVRVKVVESLTSSLLPRRVKVLLNNEEYTILSPIWKYQSFAHDGEEINIYGNVDYNRKLIILDENKYYINYTDTMSAIIS